MKVCVIGAGYVGLVAAACLAEMGNDVICVDKNEDKINQLKKFEIPIYEPNLEALIKSDVQEKRLDFTVDLTKAVKDSDICFIAVQTPQREDGSCDLQYVYKVAESIADIMNGYKIIVNKSTVPIGTAEIMTQIISSKTNEPFDVVSNPEFLKQGTAVSDFLKPDRIIIGADSEKAKNIMLELYSPFIREQHPVIVMDTKSAEMVKYASNAFLAVKISYINEIANICEAVGADINQVRIGMCADSRIGSKFLYPGIGWGGSCFPKDMNALIKTAADYNVNAQMVKAAYNVNKRQLNLFTEKIFKRFGKDLKDKSFAIWGLAFKPKTNDMREAPSIYVINALLKAGATVKVYDPKANVSAFSLFKDKIKYCNSSYEAVENSDALILITEWNEFKLPDFERMKNIMTQAVIFDGRNQYNKEKLNELGFEYYQIGN